MDTRTWKIPAANSKSKRIRTVPLNDSAIDVIKQLNTPPEFNHLFINRQTRKPYTTIAKVWIRLREKAGLSTMRIHDARHTFAHLMCAAGRTLLEVQTALGHRHYSTTSRYARLSMTTMHEASNVVSKKIGKAPLPVQQVDTSQPSESLGPLVIHVATAEAEVVET